MAKRLFPSEFLELSSENYYCNISPAKRTVYGIALVFLIFVVALLPVIKVDVSTQNRGLVRSPIENTVIQSAISGEVILFNMKENKMVSAGDTLLVMRSEKLEEQLMLEKSKFTDNISFINDITNALKDNKSNIRTSKYLLEYLKYQSKLQEQQTQIDYFKIQYNADKSMYENKARSLLDYESSKNKYESSLNQLSLIVQEQQSIWQAEKTRLELENQVIASTIRQLEKEKRQYILTAPVSGILFQVSGIQSGNFIAPNQPLAYISVSDSLLVECYVPPADIGYIRINQDVNFQVDAFDYREWGLLHGKVKEILNDVITIDNRPVFRVRCLPDGYCLHLKTGYQGCLKKGMSLTGRFCLTRRSLWQLIFDKVDDWLNPKIVTENEITAFCY
ncbi:MAG: HlyD family secretion protein [Candidatus Azobacteroides sp.]|nr:HlyD family secretion protein [Candidatus Azobacteroides sp.]